MHTELVASESGLNAELSVNNIEPDAVYIGRSLDTARQAAEYARQLNEEFGLQLLKPLRLANPKLAARYASLLNELCLMADATVRNVKKGAA